MKRKVHVALAQMDIKGMEPEANLKHMCDLIEKIMTEEKADLVVFPELANSGYVKSMELAFAKEYVLLAEKIPGNFTKTLSEQAKKYSVYIVSGMLEAHPVISPTIFNSAVLIGPSGEVIGVHRKIHLSMEEMHYFYRGNTLNVFQTELGNIGLIVCADASFPEVSRMLALKGAEIICCCYAVPKTPGWEFMNERISHIAACRAIENICFFIGCNRVGNDAGASFLGWSTIAGPMGQLLARSESETEEILRATFSEEMLREARVAFPYFIMRQPNLYSAIVEPTIPKD